MITICTIQEKEKLNWMRDYEVSLNRRSKVESELWDVSNKLRPPPTPEECKEWAVLLGVPATWKQHDQNSKQAS